MKKKPTNKDWLNMAEKYIISEASTYFNEISIQRRSENSWCIFCNGSVLNKNKGRWEREPNPSNSADNFIFTTKEEAYNQALKDTCENARTTTNRESTSIIVDKESILKLKR